LGMKVPVWYSLLAKYWATRSLKEDDGHGIRGKNVHLSFQELPLILSFWQIFVFFDSCYSFWSCHLTPFVFSSLSFSLSLQEYTVQITFREQWVDERMQYNDMDGQIRFLTLTEPGRIWKPDLFFSNEKEGHFHDIIMPNVLLRIHPNGEVLYSIRLSLVLACPMDLKYYPLDKQTCSIRMASCEDSSLCVICVLHSFLLSLSLSLSLRHSRSFRYLRWRHSLT
jgi:hypothetical protein